MRNLKLLSTTAAVLLLGTGAVLAQNMKKDEAPARAPAAQQNAPAEKVAPPIQRSEGKAPETTGQGMTKSPEMKGDAKTNMKDDAKGNGKPELKDNDKSNTKSEMKANDKTNEKTGASDTSKSPNKAADQAKPGSNTTGQGAAAGSAKLSTEQRTKITTVIKKQNVERVHLNITVRVGARVTENIRFYPLPVEVFTVYPEWRGYEYIMVGEQIIVLDPRTHEIVAVLDA
jgi:hypothetical protein